jgi:hypothetical protein
MRRPWSGAQTNSQIASPAFIWLFWRLREEYLPILNGFSPQVVPRSDDWNEHIHITGYWFPEDPDWQPLTELSAFIEAGGPLCSLGLEVCP